MSGEPQQQLANNGGKAGTVVGMAVADPDQGYLGKKRACALVSVEKLLLVRDDGMGTGRHLGQGQDGMGTGRHLGQGQDRMGTGTGTGWDLEGRQGQEGRLGQK